MILIICQLVVVNCCPNVPIFGSPVMVTPVIVTVIYPETLKYWAGVQWGQSHLVRRRCLFSLGW